MKTVLTIANVTLAALVLTSAAHATVVTFDVVLDGPSESPANASPGTGFGQVDFDSVAHTMRVQVSFSGLTGTTTASHIHAATAVPGTGTIGVATQTPTFVGFPLGVTSGTYDNTFDMTLVASYNPTFITGNGGTAAGAEAALFQAVTEGRSYLNIHTSMYPGGEIRGFLTQVPEPSGLFLCVNGLLGVSAFSKSRRKRRAEVS